MAQCLTVYNVPGICELNMAWAIPEYSREEVDRAGKAFAGLTDPDEFDRALAIINNWRASHYFPLNTFATTLRRKAEHFPNAVVSQRIKRLRAIHYKLQRTKKPIVLSKMQDIGGCRVVLGHISQVEKFVKEYENSDLKHKIIHQDNYIAVPKRSGYRGIHLIYIIATSVTAKKPTTAIRLRYSSALNCNTLGQRLLRLWDSSVKSY